MIVGCGLKGAKVDLAPGEADTVAHEKKECRKIVGQKGCEKLSTLPQARVFAWREKDEKGFRLLAQPGEKALGNECK